MSKNSTGNNRPKKRQPTIEPNNQAKPSNQRGALSLMGLGIEIAGLMAFFSYVGYKIDKKMGHRVPWLMIIGLTVAFTGRMYLLYKETKEWHK